MATATQKIILHAHNCPSCHVEWMCDELACCPDKPGKTERTCDGCASHPKTLLDLRREFLDGASELYNAFFASIAEQEQLTPEQQEQVGGYLSGSVERRDRLADFVKGLEEEAARIHERERQLATRRQEFEKLAKMFRSSVLVRMLNWNGKAIKRVDGLESSFVVRNNPQSVEITDLSELPGKFISYEPKPDKNAIKDALARGEKVPGARYSDPTQSLQIR